MAPSCIRLTELADLLGIGRRSLSRACERAGLPVVQVRRVIEGLGGGPHYLPIESAVQVATAILGKKCDNALKARIAARVKKQNEAFGGARIEVGLAHGQ
jgi:hypothetical protein